MYGSSFVCLPVCCCCPMFVGNASSFAGVVQCFDGHSNRQGLLVTTTGTSSKMKCGEKHQIVQPDIRVWTVAGLQKQLRAHGITFPSSTNKAGLFSHLLQPQRRRQQQHWGRRGRQPPITSRAALLHRMQRRQMTSSTAPEESGLARPHLIRTPPPPASPQPFPQACDRLHAPTSFCMCLPACASINLYAPTLLHLQVPLCHPVPVCGYLPAVPAFTCLCLHVPICSCINLSACTQPVPPCP